MLKRELDTPCLVVDYEILKGNIEGIARRAEDQGIAVRPHIKTHKTVEIAKMQIKAGSKGITVAKLGEAEVMAQAGITDILMAYPLIGRKKAEKFCDLSEEIQIRAGVDSMEGARGLSQVGADSDTILEVFLIVDTGGGRCGITPDQSGLEFARKVDDMPGIEIRGIFTYEGHSYTTAGREEIERVAAEDAEKMVSFADDLAEVGIEDLEISLGSTPTARLGNFPAGVEIRPGTYVFNDRNQIEMGTAEPEDCALSVLTTVVSRPKRDRAIIDAGSKSLTSELSIKTHTGEKAPDYGLIRGKENVIIEKLTEEHGNLRLNSTYTDLNVGDRLEIIPNHVCPVVNLFDEMYIVENGEVTDCWQIAARGRNR